MEHWMSLGSIALLSLAGFVVVLNYHWLLRRPTGRCRPPLEILYEPDGEEPEVDIIAVHGLGADVDRTWTWKHEDKLVNWLADRNMLPTIVGKARILVYNYDSAWHANAPKTRLELRGEALVRDIDSFLSGNRDRPIILVGHSLGGLVIEYGLVFAKEQSKFHHLIEQTVGCIFLGTPFRGSKAQGLAYFAAQMMFLARSHTGIIRDLVYDNTRLGDVLQNFCQLVTEFSIPIFCFSEGHPTDYGRKFGIPNIIVQMVVGGESACIKGHGRMELQVDHTMLNKFAGPQDSSFSRVANEIRTMTTNMGQVLKGRKAGRNLHHIVVPLERNRDFIGREPILQELREKADPYADTKHCQRTVLEGLGGVGKTQIALEAAHRIRDNHPDCSVFWVPAVDAMSFENAYREIGRRLDVKGIDDDKADVKQLVKATLSHQDSGTWLLVIDNADDTKLLLDKTTSSPLAQYLPSSESGSILFTTRNHELAVDLVDTSARDIIPVNEMSNTEAHQLLTTGLKYEQISDTASIASLLDFLVNLPLAIKQASAYMAKKGVTVARYLHYCQSTNEQTIKLLSQDFEDLRRYSQIKNPIATTWLISFEHILRDNPLAAQYLRCMCFLAEKDVPTSLLPLEDDEMKADEAIGILKAYAFITPREGPDSFDIHRLVRLAMQNWVGGSGEQEECVTMTLQLVAKAFPFPEHENREVWMRYLPHAQSILQFRGVTVDDGVAERNLLYSIGESFYLQGNYEAAEVMQRQEWELCEKVLGCEHPKTLASMNNLARMLDSLGRYEAAEEMHRQEWELCEKVLGREHPDTLISMNNVALVLDSLGRYEAAEAMHQQVLELRKKVLGHEHPDTLTSMNNLALVLDNLGRYEAAEAMHQQALELRKKVLGHEHPSTLTSMNNLALVLDNLGRYEAAEAIRTEGMERQRR